MKSINLAALVALLAIESAQAQRVIITPSPSTGRQPVIDEPQPRNIDEFRTINGQGNNPFQPNLGMASTSLPLRSDYNPDAINFSYTANPRAISNEVCVDTVQGHSQHQLSDLYWLWGQFLDHDITLVPQGNESMPIPIPRGDRFFDPQNQGNKEIKFNRSQSVFSAGMRTAVNDVTAFIDGSQVYGSDARTASLLRDPSDRAKLRMSAGQLLPKIDEVGSDDGGTGRRGLFAAGDVRANEHIGLAAIHTIFVREHNRLVPLIRKRHPEFSRDDVYEFARLIVGSQIQRITYQEFLPLLIGRPLPPYQGYDSRVDPRIENVFAGAAYRFGHSMLSETLTVYNQQGRQISLPLKELFFKPNLYSQLGVGNILAGFGSKKASKVDTRVVESVRSFLFGPPGSPGSDLAAINIQRGRDHNLPPYNTMRELLGYEPVYYFQKQNAYDEYGITSDPQLATQLERVYQDVDNVDLWIGGLAEDGFFGSFMGPTFTSIIIEQFLRLREGDRFWYESVFPQGYWRNLIDASTFAAVLKRNTQVPQLIDQSPFMAD